MRIALFGLAADPPHLCHLEVARLVLRVTAEDEIWLVPCRRHKFGKDMTAAKHRYEMCRLMVRNEPRMKVFDYEIKHELPGETFHFLDRLKKDEGYVNLDWSFVISLDNANIFDRWYKCEALKRMVRFIVVPRNGYEPISSVQWYRAEPHIFITEEPPTEISSTQIRQWLAEGNEAAFDFLDPAVAQYIEENGLYGS